MYIKISGERAALIVILSVINFFQGKGWKPELFHFHHTHIPLPYNKNSTSEEYKVRLANKMIKDLYYDENDIDGILSLLGDKYEDIILNEDGVTLDNTLWNKELVTTLKTKGYILNPRTAENKNIRIKKK